MSAQRLNIFSRVNNYRKLILELGEHLSKSPDDWPKFQGVFDLSADRVYQDILEYEEANTARSEAEVYKLKRIFEKRYRRYFLYGEYIKWCLEKPFGYAGDFKIIDNIYRCSPTSSGLDRIWDNWFLQLAAAKAVRERKEDFKRIILDFSRKHKKDSFRILDLASGPAREIKELLETDTEGVLSQATFDCCDVEVKALEYAKSLLAGQRNVNFFQKNAIRLSLKKNIKEEIPYDYDLIYSTGLFDYLDERVAVRLVGNLRKLLKKGGIMLISNMRDKYSNASAAWMEWVVEWYLIYRTESEFKKIFLDAGIPAENLQIILQQSKVMQYALVKTE